MPGKPRKPASCQQRCAPTQLGALMHELLGAFFDLRAAGQRIGAVADWGGGTWGILRTIDEGGPITMAEFARRRAVSRQYIQKIANELIAQGYLTLADNPRHRRSGLLSLTAAGRRHLREMSARIQQELAGWSEGMDGKSVGDATRVVAEFRRRITGTK